MTTVQIRRLDKATPLRWNAKQGEPQCVIEWILQHTWLLGPYIAIVVTVMLVLQLKGL